MSGAISRAKVGLVRPASLLWLVLHDVRVKARGREAGRWGRIIAIGLLAILPVVGGAAMAWRVRGAPMLPVGALGYVAAAAAGLLLVMLSSAYAHVLRLGRDRGELELLLTAPVPVARVVAGRVAGVQAVVALPFLLLTAPFFVFSAALGHVGWLAGPRSITATPPGTGECWGRAKALPIGLRASASSRVWRSFKSFPCSPTTNAGVARVRW